MIIVYNKNTAKVIYFPKNIYKSEQNSFKLTLTNRGTNVSYDFEDLEDEVLVPVGYYTFTLDFSELQEDEYEYVLLSDDKIYSKGIIKLIDSDKETIFYDKNREYVVYENE